MDPERLIKSRLRTRIVDALRHARNEAEDIERIARDIDLDDDVPGRPGNPVITSGHAVRLAKAATDLVMYTAAIVALNDAYELLGGDE